MAKELRAPARPQAAIAKAGRPKSPEAKPSRAVPPPSPPPAPPKPNRYAEAVMLYERGVDLLQRREYVGAALRLREVIERYPEERELAERARLYLRVCERELEPRAQAPRTVEERVYAATIALNAGDDATAFSLLSDARSEAPDNGYVRYMLAAVQARRGARDEALAELRRAADLDPESRLLARRDADFEELHDDEEFLRVTEPPPAARRRQRPRVTR